MPIAGIEHMTGHSINILPLVVPITKKKLLLDFIRDIRDIQTEWTCYEYIQVDRVYEWLNLQGNYPLFDHYIVFQNLGSISGEIRGMERNKNSSQSTVELVFAKMDYPLRFDIFPGDRYCFIFQYYLNCFTTAALKGLLDNLKILIERLMENPSQTVEEWTASVDINKYKFYENESPDEFVQQ